MSMSIPKTLGENVTAAIQSVVGSGPVAIHEPNFDMDFQKISIFI